VRHPLGRNGPDDPRRAALDYLARGWSVIPLRPRDKRPAIAWQDYQQALPAADAVGIWFTRWPDANLGIVTGRVSGLVVMDVDPEHGGADSLSALQRRHGALPPTMEATSGGGGRHLYFAHPGGHVRNRVALAPGIDLRGDGGMIVAPPSVHPSGRRYAWRAGRGPGEAAPAALPRWLLEDPASGPDRAGHPADHWRRLLAEGVSEGARNNTIASIAGHLLWHGLDPDAVTELLLCWNRERCRPPLADAEVARTVQSISRLHEREDDADAGP
jgi:hypothetical protein